MKYSTILLAAGRGSRTHLDYNKVFYKLRPDQTVLDRCLQTFTSDPDCEQIIVVCADYELDKVQKEYGHYPNVSFVIGGAARQDSVWNGLEAVDQDYVLIHDAARPYLSRKDLEALKKTLEQDDAALLMVAAVDTIKVVDENNHIIKTLKRSQVYHAQTPQGFRTDVIKEAHRKGREAGFEATDDAQMVEEFGSVPVICVPGDPSNKKITHPGDLRQEESCC